MRSLSAVVPAVFACLLPATVLGHGYMTIPTGRTTDTINDMDNTGVCDSSEPGTVTEFEAGESIQVQWSRNNHIGGFIRFSLAPKDDATKATFDDSAFYYVCREVNCDLKECGDNKYCGDDAGTVDNEIKCGTNITLPDYLDAGDYVLQWTWFAAGSSYGHIGWTTGNYRTCADIRLTTSGSAASKPSCPTFVGGDRVTEIEGKSSGQCFYFDTNDLVTKEVQYDDDTGYTRYLYGVPAEVERCSGSGSASNASVSVPSSESGSNAAASGNGATPTSSAADDWEAENSGNDDTTSVSGSWSSDGEWSDGGEWSTGGDWPEGGENADENASGWSEDNDADSTNGWGGSDEIGNEGDDSLTGSGDAETSTGSASDGAVDTPTPTPVTTSSGCRAKKTRQ